MAYGTLAVDYITYTSNSVDVTATVSSVINGNFPNASITGTISGNTITGNSGQFGTLTAVTGIFTNTLSGSTITGATINFTNLTGVSGTFTNRVSGATITGTSGLFTSGLITILGAGQTSPITTIDISGAYSSNINAVSALSINCSSGNFFTKTITSGSTFTVTGVPASRAYSFTIEITHTAGTITWFSGVEWPNGTAPTLTSGKTHLFMFVTDDGGTRWRGSSLINYTN